MIEKRCCRCQKFFLPNPRVKNQRYCNRPECQRARKALWQKQKIHQDPDYQANQRDAQVNWLKRRPDYFRSYRAGHPSYVETNRLNQKKRDRKKRLVHLAKMDTLKPHPFVNPGSYFLIPNLAKMGAFVQKIFIIPATSTDWPILAKKDSIDFKGSSLLG